MVLGPHAWAHAEEELRIRREQAVEVDDADGRVDAGTSASTSTSSSPSSSLSSAYCVLWSWSRADEGWRWVYTSEGVCPCLFRRRGRRRTGGGKRGSSASVNGNSLCSWSPLDLSCCLRSREAREAAATASVIHLHVHAGEIARDVAPCSSSGCPCGAGGRRGGGTGDPLLLSATLRLEDAAFVPEGESESSYPSGAVVATLGAERVAWVPRSKGGAGKEDEAQTTTATTTTTAATTTLLLPLPPPPPSPPPTLLSGAARAAAAKSKAAAATRALDLLLEERRQGRERASELARASSSSADSESLASSLEERAAALREATARSKSEIARRVVALVEAQRGLKTCLERVEQLQVSVSGAACPPSSAPTAAAAAATTTTAATCPPPPPPPPPHPPSARAVLGRALASLVARRCSLVAGIGEAMELTPKSVAAASSKEQRRQSSRRASSSPSSPAAGGGEGERQGGTNGDGGDKEEDGNGDSTLDRLESGWSSGLGGIRQQQQQAGTGTGASPSPPPKQTTICGLPLDPSVAGRGWQQRPNLPSKAQLDADAAALASAAAATSAIASVLGLPLRHPLRPVPSRRGAAAGGVAGSGGGGAAVALAPPPAGAFGERQQKGKSSKSQATSSSCSSAPAVVDAIGAAMLFPRATVAPSTSSSFAAVGLSANGSAPAANGSSSSNSSSVAAPAASTASLLPSLLSPAAEFPLFLPGSTVGCLSSSGGGGIGGIGASASVPPSSSASDDAAALLASTEPARFAYAVFLLNRDVQQLLDAHGLAGSGPGAAVDGLAKLVEAAASVASLK